MMKSMSEHHPDIDLIMALAAGLVAPDEAARLEETLDDEARLELAAQRIALQALSQLPRPAMASEESSRMRAAVRAELGLEVVDRAEPLRRRQRPGAWFARRLPSLVVVASLVAVIGIALTLTGDDRADEEPPFAAVDAPTTTATTEGAAPAETSAPAATAVAASVVTESATEPLDAAAGLALAEAEEAMAAEAPADEVQLVEESAEFEGVVVTDTPAAATTTTTSTDTSLDDPPVLVRFAFDFSTDRPEEVHGLTSAAFAVEEGYPFPVSQLAEMAARAGLVCWESAAGAVDPDGQVFFMAHGLIDGNEGEVYRIEEAGADEGDAPVDEDYPGVVHLFAYPDCRRVTFSNS